MTDHQRADSIGMIQCGREVTPNLNQLVSESIHFTRAYDTCPLCVPARTALATGHYPTENGVTYNDWKGETAGSFPPIHRILKDAGYFVGHVGVDHIKVQPPMVDQGLDFFINQEDYEAWAKDQGLVTTRNPEELTEVSEEIEGAYVTKRYSNHRASVFPHPKEQFKDFYFLNQALRFLENARQQEKPFALFLYLWAPHPPLRVPAEYAHLYAPETVTLPDNVGIPSQGEPPLRRKGVPAQLAAAVSQEEWRQVWAAHLGLVTMADEILGTVVRTLKTHDLYDNAWVICTADHGDQLGQHAMYQKMEMYEESVHVPLVIKPPHSRTAATADSVVSHLDLWPTLCQLAGTEAGNCDGQSLIPVMEGRLKMDPDRLVYAQYSGNPGKGTIRRAAITQSFKYIYDSEHQKELYDLQKDPGEHVNVADDPAYREILTAMHEACRNYHETRNDDFQWEE